MYFFYGDTMSNFEEELNKAKEFYSKMQFHSALDIYKKLYNENPNNVTVINNLVSTYIKIYDYNQAIKYADIYLDLNPNNLNVLFSKIVALINLKRFDDALDTIDKVIEIAPMDLNAYTFKYKILNALNKEDDKRVFFRDLKNFSPRMFTRLIIALGFLKEQGDDITLREFDNLAEAKINKKSKEIVNDFSFLYEDIQNPFVEYRQNLFVDILQDLADNNPNLHNILDLMVEDDYEKALDELNKQLTSSIDNDSINESLDVNKDILFSKNNEDLLIFKSVILFYLNDEKDAFNIINNLLDIESNSFEIWAIRAIIQTSLGNYNNASRSFKKALNINDENPDLWILYIYSLALNDNIDKALEENEHALETIPDSDVLKNNLENIKNEKENDEILD